jgi:hypothetical protein
VFSHLVCFLIAVPSSVASSAALLSTLRASAASAVRSGIRARQGGGATSPPADKGLAAKACPSSKADRPRGCVMEAARAAGEKGLLPW